MPCAFTMQGEFVAGPLDSGDPELHVASGGSARYRSDQPRSKRRTSSDSTTDITSSPFVPCLKAGSDDNDPDCLVQRPRTIPVDQGPRLGSGGVGTPQIRAIKLRYPREKPSAIPAGSLPAGSGEPSFSRRLVPAQFQRIDDIDQKLDYTPASDRTHSRHGSAKFQWLASWLALAIDPDLQNPSTTQPRRA